MPHIIELLNNSSIIAVIAFLIPFFIFLRRFKKPKKATPETSFSEKLLEDRIKEFKPEPLIKPVDPSIENSANAIYEEDRFIIDLGKVNYLNLLNNKEIMQNAAECIKQYGVGTCGPRGFYGTTDVHLNLEKSLAQFLGTEEAIVYAYGFTTLQSAIMTYCKQDDLLFCDEYINFPIKQGALSSRSQVIYFKHNDAADLRRKLEEKRTTNKRKFLVVEGIYEKTGTVCALPKLLKHAKEHRVRVFVDESISFGVIGVNGKGILEHYHIPIEDVDLIIGSLENALGSIGGFCAGSNVIIEPQRLCSAGYVYSASLPTYLSEVSISALPMVENNSIFLQILSTKFQEFLCSISSFKVVSDPISPLKIVTYYKEMRSKTTEEAIYEYCRDHCLYFILSSSGLIMHLNVELYFNEDRLAKVFEIISNAVQFCSEKC